PYLGKPCDAATLMQACEAALNRPDLTVLWDTRLQNIRTLDHFAELQIEHQTHTHTLTADWVILAEGGMLAETLPGIRRRNHDYRPRATVTTLEFAQPQNGPAYERFSDTGPLSLLPYRPACRLGWARCPEGAQLRRD
ncbi:2-polyprenyl-6-methoxyphenol hydroxylase, partial [Neisseria dumasiana]